MDIILHLGGNPLRVEKTIKIAKANPGAFIVISSEGDPVYIATQLQNAGIKHDQYVFDFNAWDTVTNFSKTYGFIEDRLPLKLYIVTDKFHMKRAKAIAKMVYLYDPIQLVECPHFEGDPERQEPQRFIIEDTLRALLWRLTGYLYYDKRIKQARTPGLEADKKRAIENGYPVNRVVA